MIKLEYIPKDKRKSNGIQGNKIEEYVRRLLLDESLRYNIHINKIMMDMKKGCIYIPEACEKVNGRNIVDRLKKEIEENVLKEDCINWSKHYKIENPKKLPIFNEIVDLMAKKLNVKVIETRLNYYPNEKSWKPFHQDRHSSYNKEEEGILKENFTMGASFGASRALAFKHIETETTFEIPQKNGDIFAFDANINKLFMHGVPISKYTVGERFSIIAWGLKL